MAADSSVDLELMRASLLLDRDPAAAAHGARDILARAPGHPEASLLLAAACRKIGRADAAIQTLESLPGPLLQSPLIQLELGRAYAGANRATEAVSALRRAVELDPGLADGWQELATQLFASGGSREGDLAYARYRALARDPPELSDAILALADNRLATAESSLQRRIERAPHDVLALRMLAEVALRREDAISAEQWLSRSLAIAPGYAAARHELARLLITQERHAEALPLIVRLLAAEPDRVEYLSLKAQALRLQGRTGEAISLMEAVLAAHPQEDAAWLLHGHLLREVGQQPRAIEMYRRALSIRPSSGAAYWSLANLKTVHLSAADIEAMQERLADSSVRGLDRIQLEFALGKALEDEGRYELSFEHYACGNASYRATINHSPEATSADVERSQQQYTRAFFAERSGWGSPCADPIFIVGVPRSGSTLLEQILASHSQVEGTRELQHIPVMARELMLRANRGAQRPYPQPVAALDRAQIAALAADYLSRSQPYRTQGKPRFVDKMLSNFGHIGLIHLLFPNSAIIDVRRHPLGCGLSCFRQLFARGQGFSYDLEEFARYYRDYARLMAHFDEVLPGRVHRVHYEQLVADPEKELRSVLDYCGLPFERECLRFYQNPRVVQTISSEQVRRPIYAESVDQWRHYERWLAPLTRTLGELVTRYPLPASRVEA